MYVACVFRTVQTLRKSLLTAAGLVDGRNRVVGELISGLAGTDMLCVFMCCFVAVYCCPVHCSCCKHSVNIRESIIGEGGVSTGEVVNLAA